MDNTGSLLSDVLYESLYEDFIKCTDNLHMLCEVGIPSSLKKVFSSIKKIRDILNVKITELISLFRNKTAFTLFAKVKFNVTKLFSIVKTGYKSYRTLVNAIGEYLSKTRVGKWTQASLVALDDFLSKHPKVSKLAGVAVGGLLVFIWLNMTFTGDFDYDFDTSSIIAAFAGKFSLAELFSGPDGMKLLTLFATGKLLGLTFPWPGPQHVQFVGALIYGVSKLVKQRVKIPSFN